MTARKPTTTRASKPAQKQEPEIHLHGDIHVHTYHDGSASVAVDSNNTPKRPHEELREAMQADMQIMGAESPAKLGATRDHAINASSPQKGRVSLVDVHAALSDAIERYSDRLDRLEHRTYTIRNGMASPIAPRDPLCDDSSSESLQSFSSLWLRMHNLTDRLDNLIDQLEL